MFSLSPSVEIMEFDLSISIPNLPSAKTGMVLRADTGQCNKIVPITSEADLIANFGKPTAANYQDWFQAWNFLQYASSLYVVRPMNTTVQNAAVIITGSTAGTDSFENFYNTEVAEQKISNDFSASTQKLTFINKNTTSKQDLALAVCSSKRFWEQPIANEFYGIVTLDGTNASTLNNIGGLTAPSYYVNLVNNTLVAGSKFIANGDKLFTVVNTYSGKVKLNAEISAADLSVSYGTVDTVNSADRLTTGIVVVTFDTTQRLNIEQNAIFSFGTVGSNLYYAETIADNVVTFKGVTGQFSGNYVAPTGEIFSNSEYYHFIPSADYDGVTDLTVPAGTTTIKVEDGFNWEEGAVIKFSYDAGNDVFDGVVNDTYLGAGDTAGQTVTDVNTTYTVIGVDKLNNLIILDTALEKDLVIANGEVVDDVVTIYSAIRGVNYYSTVYENSLIKKTTKSVSDQGDSGKTLVIIAEELAPFKNFLEYEPNFLEDEFITVILKKNSANLYEFVESKLASYRPTARDYQNKNIFANEVFLYGSNYVYCGASEDTTLQKADSATLPTLKFVSDFGSNTGTALDYYGTVYPLAGTVTNGALVLTLDTTGNPKYDASNFTKADIQNAQDLFNDSEAFDVNILISHELDMNGMATIAETRKDCIAIVAPYKVDNIVGKSSTNATLQLLYKFGSKTVDPSGSPEFSTYGTYSSIYGNIKYQYDKFNDVNRWICVAGDVAGLYAQTDKTRDPWWAPAGIERGKIKNAIKLAFNPSKPDRDELYVNSINPITPIQGEGNAIVFGQKTATAKPSALDRVNVRRLMIVIEKAVATAVKYSIFEFNDAFTRSRLVGMIDPFLRTVKARRGVYDYYVQCDASNNPPSVLDANGLVIDVYIKPTRVAEFIQVNFNILRSDANITEFIGGAGA